MSDYSGPWRMTPGYSYQGRSMNHLKKVLDVAMFTDSDCEKAEYLGIQDIEDSLYATFRLGPRKVAAQLLTHATLELRK